MRTIDKNCPGAWDWTGAGQLLISTNQTCDKIYVLQLYLINYFNEFLIFSPETILNDSLFKSS